MTATSPSDHLLTVREGSEFLHVTPGTIYRMTRARTIPGAFRVMGSWRFDVEQLHRWTKTAECGAALGMQKRDREQLTIETSAFAMPF